nr:A41 [uncultured bacterium]
MSRVLDGGLAALLMIATGLFWWQGRAASEQESRRPAVVPQTLVSEELPDGDDNAVGDPPPMPTSATPESREQRRFWRYDRNHDGVILRNEMMSSRVKPFKQLDTDGNNLLSFEEWAVATGDRFAAADLDKNGRVTPAEFAATAPRPKPVPKCRC